jgi:hypothetical protein
MKRIFSVLFITLICLASAIAQAPAPDNNDIQFWNETQVIFPVVKKKDDSGKTTEKLSFFINGNLRFGQNIRHFADERIGFGFTYRQNKHLTFTPSYIYIAQQPVAHRSLFESRLRFAVGLENRWKKFSVDDRNLVEYRFRNNSADSVRYRNKLRFVYPVKKNDKELFAPFAADEVFYDFRAKAFSRNELSFGITRRLNPNISADFFYLWQVNKTGSPHKLNVIGVNLKIKID